MRQNGDRAVEANAAAQQRSPGAPALLAGRSQNGWPTRNSPASPPPHSPPQPASRRAAAAMPAPMTKMIFPLARWGAAVGAIGAFLLYEEVPQLVLQTTYGVPVTYRDVFEYAGLVAPKPVKTDDE